MATKCFGQKFTDPQSDKVCEFFIGTVFRSTVPLLSSHLSPVKFSLASQSSPEVKIQRDLWKDVFRLLSALETGHRDGGKLIAPRARNRDHHGSPSGDAPENCHARTARICGQVIEHTTQIWH